jgi:hypothetical protein
MRDWRTTGYAVLLSILWASTGLCAGMVVRALPPSAFDFLLQDGGLLGADDDAS